jgi:anti-anti-sigma factor
MKHLGSDDAPPNDGGSRSKAPRTYEPRSARQLQVMALEDSPLRHPGASDRDRRRFDGFDGFPLRISVFVTPGTVLIRLNGDLDYWTGPSLARTMAHRAEATSEVIFDLAQVGFMDGGGIRSLLAVRAQIGPDRFRVGACSPTVHRLLTLVGLTDLIEADGAPAA